jgi:hypothetical protein
MIKLLAVVIRAVLIGQSAAADGMTSSGYYYHSWYGLPPERHVIEVVQPPYSGNFIINGRRFTAKSMACRRWVAGERIRLVAGDWNGRCIDAVFYNVWRRSRCEMWCR